MHTALSIINRVATPRHIPGHPSSPQIPNIFDELSRLQLDSKVKLSLRGMLPRFHDPCNRDLSGKRIRENAEEFVSDVPKIQLGVCDLFSRPFSVRLFLMILPLTSFCNAIHISQGDLGMHTQNQRQPLQSTRRLLQSGLPSDPGVNPPPIQHLAGWANIGLDLSSYIDSFPVSINLNTIDIRFLRDDFSWFPAEIRQDCPHLRLAFVASPGQLSNFPWTQPSPVYQSAREVSSHPNAHYL
ncbi:hypothetical protein OG21DRAFT_135075 [Imleria badia]|nr:hypothetical protein OG21DRAFT_135075 [Imleria badia]